MKRNFIKIGFFAVLLTWCGLLSVVNAQITAIGPVTGTLAKGVDIGGYPQWLQDSTGMQLERIFDPAFPDESFYWMAVADAPSLDPLNPGALTQLVLAWEAAYGGTGAPANGQQIIFGRLRIRVDVPVPGDYTVTTPYGTFNFPGVTVGNLGSDMINFTEDIGALGRPPAAYTGIMASPVAPALVWDTFPADPLLADPITLAAGAFVGDGVTPHAATVGQGGAAATFTVTGPAGTTSTNLFVVLGKVFVPAPVTPHVFPPAPPQALAAVGPVNRATPFNPTSSAVILGAAAVAPAVYPLGFPLWYQDKAVTRLLKNPLHLTIPAPTDPMGLGDVVLDPPDPLLGIGGEGFYWSAEAAITDPTTGVNGLLVMALEAAFGGAGTPAEGQQMIFTRIRIRVDCPVAGVYTVTYPFGIKKFTVLPADVGIRAINFTEDLGDANPLDPDLAFNGALRGNISAFLTWPNFHADPTLTVGVNKYVGNPGVPHIVTGSPLRKNFFQIVGPRFGLRAINVKTDLFTVSGKILDVANVVSDKATTIQGKAVTIPVTANDTNIVVTDLTAVTLIVPANAAPANGTATVNAAATATTPPTITYTPNPNFYGTDTFSYMLNQGPAGLGEPPRVSALTTVTVTVKRIVEKVTVIAVGKAPNARVRWTMSGNGTPAVAATRTTPAIPGSTITVVAGADMTGTPITAAAIRPVVANRLGKWTSTVLLPVTTPLDQLAAVSAQTSDGGLATNQSIIQMRITTVTAVGILATTKGPLWNLHGNGAPGTTLTIALIRPDLITTQPLATVLVKPTGIWSFVGRVLDTLPLSTASMLRITSSAPGAAAVDIPLTSLTRATAITVGAASLKLGSLFTIIGKGIPGQTVTVFLGPNLLGQQIGTATVKTNGTWLLNQRVAVDIPVTATGISLSTSAGGAFLNLPLLVR